jgi:hypothetical protein
VSGQKDKAYTPVVVNANHKAIIIQNNFFITIIIRIKSGGVSLYIILRKGICNSDKNHLFTANYIKVVIYLYAQVNTSS